MEKYNSTNNNIEGLVDWGNKIGWFSFPQDLMKEELFNKIFIPALFVYISSKLGWIYGIAYLMAVILFGKIKNIKMNTLSRSLFKLSRNNSSQFNQNFILVSQNQDIPQDFYSSFPWSFVKEKSQETFGLGEMPPQVFIKWEVITEIRQEIAGLRQEIAETREEIINLKEKLEQKQQIIPIQFLESEKLHLRQPIAVSLSYSSEGKIWIVDCPELNLYGEGEDEQRAIDDFKNALEEFYFSLKKDKEKLGPELKKRWDILQKIVEEKLK
jgi:hypothetical protein